MSALRVVSLRRIRLMPLLLAATAAACRTSGSGQPAPAAASPPPAAASAPTPEARPTPYLPPPAAAVPAQPAQTGASRPSFEILKLKQSGASDEALLEKVRAANVRYDLTTAEILELRRAGVGEAVVEAMLRSGR